MQAAMTGSACLLVRRDNGGPLLALSAPRGLGLPGGKRGPDETPVACALRETHEETGIDLHRFAHIAQVLGMRSAGDGGLPTALVWLPSFESLGESAALGAETREGLPRWVFAEDMTSNRAAFPVWNRWALTQEMVRRLRSDADSDMMSAWSEENTPHGWAGEAYQESAAFTRSVADALERLAEMECPQ